MGCWNHTCALSNLPVFAGEEVYVFLLEEHAFEDAPSYCYPSNNWTLLPLHFNGKYNDYGSVEDCEGTLLTLIVEHVKHNLVELPVGKNQYHDIAVSKKDFDEEKLFEADHEDRLFVHARNRTQGMKEKLRLKHIVIRKDVLDQLLKEYKVQVGYSGVYRTFDELVSDAMMYHKKIKATPPLQRMFVRSHTFKNDERGGWFAQFAEYGSQFGYPQTMSPKLLMIDWVLGNKDDEWVDARGQELLQQLCVYYWLQLFMQSARKSWAPPCGVGSQDETTEAQRMLAYITIDVGNMIDRRWDEENDE